MKRFLIIGLGQFGTELAKSLDKKGAEVIVVDNNIDLIEGIKDKVTGAVCINCTDENALRALKVENFDAALVSIGENIEASILTTATLKELGMETVIARSAGNLHGKILEKVGASQIISPEVDIADQLALKLLFPCLIDHVILPDGHSIFQVKSREEFHDKTLAELDFRHNYGFFVIAIHRKIKNISDSGEILSETETISLPYATETIKKDDILVLVGLKEDMDKFLLKDK